jgi:hypothetical protein
MSAMDSSTWLRTFLAAIDGTLLSDADTAAILELAGVAAHASERMAAPLTCWAAAASGLTPDAAVAIARSLAAEGVTGHVDST